MKRLRSLFISAYIGGSASGLALALYLLASGGDKAWIGAALAFAGPTAFFASVFARPTARTSRNLPFVFVAAAAGFLLSSALAAPTSAPAIACATVLVATLLYVRWYSRFGAPDTKVLDEGKMLPSFSLSENGSLVASDTLTQRSAMWVFFRGNWCPVCVAQIQEICEQYRELARRGVDVIFVSPQPEENSASLRERCRAPMRFLTDAGNKVAARLGILEEHGLPAGMEVFGYDSDVPRPTVILTAPGGRVIHCDRTDNYRVRPEPAQFFAILDRAAAGGAA